MYSLHGLLYFLLSLCTACICIRKIAARTKSKSLEAAAKDNLSDALVSIGTVVGIVGSQFQMPILDPIAALIVGLIICKTAWEIFVESSYANRWN